MKYVSIDNRQDFRLHNPQYVGNDIIIDLQYLESEDGLRFFPAQTNIVLENMANERWAIALELWEQKLKEVENGDLLG